MHMADALVSPAVGGTMIAAMAGVGAHCARKLAKEGDEGKVPLMAVLGAFVFAAQMVNFTIPATGSSGHLGGGMILAILLGPHAAFLVIASVLTVQALFFADGGLLALGCNVFNMGFFPCFIAYPFIYKAIAGARPTQGRIFAAATLSGVVALQLGAAGVVLETVCSGISELPVRTFLLLMLPIHLAIGLVEGLVTMAVVTFVWKARPEVLEAAAAARPAAARSSRPVVAGFLAAALATGGALAWFASAHPDGLEWVIGRVTGKKELAAPTTGVHAALARAQEHSAILPDYQFKSAAGEDGGGGPLTQANEQAGQPAAASSASVRLGTSMAGLVGAIITLLLAGAIGLAAKMARRQPNSRAF